MQQWELQSGPKLTPLMAMKILPFILMHWEVFRDLLYLKNEKKNHIIGLSLNPCGYTWNETMYRNVFHDTRTAPGLLYKICYMSLHLEWRVSYFKHTAVIHRGLTPCHMSLFTV